MKIFQLTIKTFLIIIVSGMLTSCYYDEMIKIDKPVEVGEVSFENDIVPIFNASCNTSGCHNGSVAPNLLPANAYSALTNGDYVNTSNPEDSELYQWMKGNRGLPMPLSGSDATYNAKVLAWIKQGALND